MARVALVCMALTGLLLGSIRAAGAQEVPAGPVRVFGDRLRIGGEVVGTLGSADTVAFFNYTDYERNALRMFRLALAVEWRAASRVSFIGELRAEDFEHAAAHAAYVRVRPWLGHRFDIQVGRIPPTFGAFGRRAYSLTDGPIGYPLAYQYLTSLRPDAAPMSTDDLLRMRARGWRSEFPIGNPTPAPGVPLVSAFRWDTGVQAHWASDVVTLTGAVTNGTLSTPRVGDDNDGKQVSGRITVRPVFGLIAGASVARGAWLSREVLALLPAQLQRTSYAQTSAGGDVEYSRDHWILRAELVWSQWRVPTPASAACPSLDVSAMGAFVEARYRMSPRTFAAVRVDSLTLSSIRGTAPDASLVPWDAPVRRIELAAGYYLQRNLTARVAIQANHRDEGRARGRTFVSGQLAYWF